MAWSLQRLRRAMAAGAVRKGDTARAAGDWAGAAAAYRRALGLDPNHWPIWVQLGHALKESGRVTEAAPAYMRALRIAPEVSDTALHLGHAHKLAGDLSAARRWYALAATWHPPMADALVELAALGPEPAAPSPTPQPSAGAFGEHVRRGDAARDARDWQAAAREYRLALADADAAPIWVQLGHALKESAAYEEARAAYLRALKAEPENADTALSLGHLAKVSGDHGEAAAWYARALAWPPGEPDAAIELARLGYEGEALERLVDRICAPPPAPTPAPAGPGAYRVEWPTSDWLEGTGAALPEALARHGLKVVDDGDTLVANLEPRRFDRLTALRLRDRILSEAMRLVVVTPDARAWLAIPHAFGELAEMASAFVVFTDQDRRLVEDRLERLGLPRTVLREDLGPRAPAVGAKRTTQGPDVFLAGELEQETAAFIEAHARLGSGRRLEIISPGAPPMDLAACRSLAVAGDAPGLESWIVRAIEAGTPVLATPHGRAYPLFGSAVSDYVNWEDREALSARWRALAPARTAQPPDAPRWADAVARALTRLGVDAGGLANPPGEAPLLPFGTFARLADDAGGLRFARGPGWALARPDGLVLDGAASLRLRAPPHRSRLRVAVLYARAGTAGRLRMRARSGPNSGKVLDNLGKDAFGWAVATVTPEHGWRARIDVDLAPDGGDLLVAGVAVYPVLEDRYWFEMLDRAARGLEPELWTAARRLAARGIAQTPTVPATATRNARMSR